MSDTDEVVPTPARNTSGSPGRYRVTIPAADSTVTAWMESQENVSASLRMVIREYIERHGIDDPTCRVVRQLPRKGRPPNDSVFVPDVTTVSHENSSMDDDADEESIVGHGDPSDDVNTDDDDGPPLGYRIAAARGTLPTAADGQIDVNQLMSDMHGE